MEQQSDGWHTWRSMGIGSSDAPAVMGVCPYRSRKELLLDKLGRGKPFKSNPAMQLGVKFEPVARALSYFDMDIEFEPATLIHPDLDFVRASLDGICNQTKTIAEIKYMGVKNFIKCAETLSALEHHYPQVQHQLAVTGFKLAYYIPYTLTENKREIDKIAYIKVDRDDQYIERLLTLEKEFWNEVVHQRSAQSVL